MLHLQRNKSDDIVLLQMFSWFFLFPLFKIKGCNKFKLIIMQEGTVKFFNETKGFGFIVDSENGKDVFVHMSGLVDKVKENDRVTFEVQETPKGLSAVNVKVIR